MKADIKYRKKIRIYKNSFLTKFKTIDYMHENSNKLFLGIRYGKLPIFQNNCC